MEDRRVAVTGIGAICCLGLNVQEIWDNLIAGRCGLGLVTKLDLSQYKSRIGGEIKNFDVTKFMSEKDARHLDPFCQYAVAASEEALRDSGLGNDFRTGTAVAPERVGVCVSSGIGGISTLEEQIRILNERGPTRVSPFLIPMMIGDMASGQLSIRYGAKGPNLSIITACATASHSIGESFWMVKRGDADVMITGGAEACMAKIAFAGFSSMKALSQRNDDPQHASRPFDKDRDGFVMSEGSGVLILEELEHAKKRGAKIYGEVVGYGATGDAFHITSPAPGGEGGARAMQVALRHAGLNPEDVDYVNAHGTSTCLNDKYETAAIKAVFGDHARKMAVSSTKGGMGHSLGAAGGLETIVCLKTIQTGIIPPTINYTTPDPECDLDYTPNTARQREVKVAVNTNLGFGGHNGVIVVKKI